MYRLRQNDSLIIIFYDLLRIPVFFILLVFLRVWDISARSDLYRHALTKL